MDDLQKEREQIEQDLRLADSAFACEYVKLASTWRASVGAANITVRLDSNTISLVYVLFNIARVAA